MRDKISALLGISSEEELKVSMLLTQSVFIGIFIGAFDITAYSMLLSTFDEKLMARGYIVSGVAGIILTAIYLKLRSKSDTGKFTTYNLLFFLAVTASLWVLMVYSGKNWVIFLVFIMLAPLNILSFLSFWRTAEQVFKGKPEKIFRFLEGGQLAGIMIVSFLIVAVLTFKIQTHNILLISIVSIIEVIIVQTFLNKRYNLNSVEKEDDSEDMIIRLPLFVQKNSYRRTLGLFAALSVLTAFIIQYLFMAVSRKQFPASADMAAFLGLFTGIMMIFNMFMKFVGFPFIRHNFRIKVSLMISPALIAGLSVVAIISCFSMNLMQAAEGYMFVVVILGFNRLISNSFKNSVEIPSYKILYQSVDKKIGSEIQSGLDGTVNEMGLTFSGVILAGFGLFSFINLNHFSILLLIISLIWFFTGIKLLKEYKASLEHIAPLNLPKQDSPAELKNKFASSLEFRKDYFRIITGKYSALNNISPAYFEELSAQAISKNDITLIPALRKIISNSSLESTMRNRSQEIVDSLSKKSVAVDEGIRLLSGTRLPQTTEILRLLRNNSIESKRQAIHIIGKFRICDLLSVVCESLNTPGLSKDAYEVLLSFGEGVEDELVRFYLVNSGNLKLSRVILHLLGNTCSKESTGFLFSQLWSNSRQIKEISIKGLLNCKFKPSEEENIRLDNLVFDIIGIITWNMGAEIILEREKNEYLRDVIRLEIERWEAFLFNILSLNYGKDIFGTIRKNLSESRMESISHALEIVREVVSDSIKPVLIILLDDLPVRKKLKKLSEYYPAEFSGHKNLAEDIINRDYNLISIWAKACTLRNIDKIEGKEMAESVTALLFSPEEIIREEAAYLIARSNPEIYFSTSERIPIQVRRKLDKILEGKFDKKEMLFEKVQFLNNSFAGIPSWELFTLAGNLHFTNNPDSDFGDCDDGCILWLLNDGRNRFDVQIVYNGALSKLKERLFAETPHFGEIFLYRLSLDSVEEFNFQYPDHSQLLLGYINSIQ